MKKKIFTLVVLCLCSWLSSYAQKVFDAEALKEDFIVIKDIVLALSPRITVEDKEGFEKAFKSRIKELDKQSLTAIEFSQFLGDSYFKAKFDDHFYLALNEGIMEPYLSSQTKVFPIPIRFIGKHIIINSTTGKIPYGSSIKSINGISCDSIMALLLHDKDNTFLKKNMERQFAVVLSTQIESCDDFTVTYTSSINDSTIGVATVDGLSHDEYCALEDTIIYPLNRQQLSNHLNTSFYDDSKTFYMQLNSFRCHGNKKRNKIKQFRTLLETTFDSINSKGAEHLIIDLRYNFGGMIRTPALLYTYIAEEAFNENVKLEMKNVTLPHSNYIVKLSRHNGPNVPSPKRIDKFSKSIKHGFEDVDGEYVRLLIDDREHKPRENAFTGDVYLLVGGNTFSASVYFTSLFKAYDRGTIIGEQIGSSHHFITAGESAVYQLPNTKIEFGIPLMSVSFAEEIYQKVPEKTIIPDIQFSEELEYDYFMKKKDIELLETLKLIKEKRYSISRETHSSTLD